MTRERTLKHRIAAILVALMVMIAFMPLKGGVKAEAITYTNTSLNKELPGFPNNYGPVISSDKAEYELGENIYIKVENSATATGGGWIGIYKDLNANPDTQTEAWAYTGSSTVADVEDYVIYGPDKNSGVTVNTALGAGDYYIIHMASDGRWAVLPITITAPPSSMSLEKTRFKVGEAINVTAESSYNSAWVGLYPYAGGDPLDNGDLLSWYNLSDADSDVVDILHDECVQDKDKVANLSAGRYKAILFTGGWDIDTTTGGLMIRSFYIEHAYADPTWSWNDDYSEATATFACVDDPNAEAKTVTVSGDDITSQKTDSTCTEQGEAVYTATLTLEDTDFLTESDKRAFSNTTEPVVIEKKAHTLTKTDKVDATCQQEGTEEYWTCSECEKMFSDEEGKTEIEAPVVIEKKAHTLTKTEKEDATCEKEGTEEYWTCSECKKLFSDAEGKTEIEKPAVIEKKAHDLTKTDKVDATCEKEGTEEYWTCSECKKLFSDAEGKTEIEKPAVIEKKAHSLTKTDKVDATCEKEGTEEYWTCSECKKMFSDAEGKTEIEKPAVIEKAAHALTKVDKVEPTTEAEGTEEYWKCSVCGKLFSDAEGKTEITEPKKIDKLQPIEPIQPTDPEKQMGADGTPVGKGASAQAAEKAITSMKSDSDPKGTEFSVLKLKSTKQTKSVAVLNWAKAKNAVKYVIYGNKCGKGNKMNKVATATGNTLKVKAVAGKKLAKGKSYKFIVVALDKNNTVVSTSKVIHVVTAGTKAGNYKAVSIAKKTLKKAKALKKGKSLKLRAKLVTTAKKKVSKHTGLRYESTNSKIATVSSKGVIKAKGKGKCIVYAAAQNGVCKAVKVVVK